MGFDVTGPGTGVNTRWFGIEDFVLDHAEELNRTLTEAYELVNELLDDPETEVWTAHMGDQIVGFVALHIGLKASDRHTAHVRILVTNLVQGKGVGTALMRAALKWADEHDIVRITATPYVKVVSGPGFVNGYDSASAPKVKFFTRFGFQVEGLMRNAARVNGEFTSVGLLARVRNT